MQLISSLQCITLHYCQQNVTAASTTIITPNNTHTTILLSAERHSRQHYSHHSKQYTHHNITVSRTSQPPALQPSLQTIHISQYYCQQNVTAASTTAITPNNTHITISLPMTQFGFHKHYVFSLQPNANCSNCSNCSNCILKEIRRNVGGFSLPQSADRAA